MRFVGSLQVGVDTLELASFLAHLIGHGMLEKRVQFRLYFEKHFGCLLVFLDALGYFQWHTIPRDYFSTGSHIWIDQDEEKVEDDGVENQTKASWCPVLLCREAYGAREVVSS